MCGSEAILTSRFGVVTDAKKRPNYYDVESASYTLQGGIIAAKNKIVYELCGERVEKQTGTSLEMHH